MKKMMQGTSQGTKPLYEAPRGWRWYWWKFVHNGLIHPWLAFPCEPKWAQDAHDWTAKRCIGGG